MKATFSRMEKVGRSFVLSILPRTLEIAFKDFLSRKIVWGSTSPNPLEKEDINDPCRYSRLLFSNLLVTLIFIETPVSFQIVTLYFFP